MMWVPDAAFAWPWELCRVGVLPCWSFICRRCQWTVLWEVWKGEGDSLIAQQPRIRPSKSFSSFTTTDKYTVQFGIVFGNLDCLLDCVCVWQECRVEEYGGSEGEGNRGVI